VVLGATTHAALKTFQIVQELSSQGDKTLLGKSKSGNLVAIRVLAEATIPEDVASALSREASTAARLGHETIVQARMMLLETDFAALVTEFVPGVSLQRICRFSQGRGVRLPDVATWYVIERIFSALAYSHALKDGAGAPAPVLHRELSPASVVIGWSGVVKVGDFGLTRARALVAALQKSTFVPDSPPLVSPEQARGEDPTQKSDVFCAALIALRLASGRTPYARYRDKPDELKEAMSAGKLHGMSKLRPDLPDAVKTAFDRALEPEPSARTITAQEIVEVLRANFDVAKGKEKLTKLVGRWRPELEQTVTPWEKTGSNPDAGDVADAKAGDLRDGALALAMPDERPSSDSIWTGDKKSEAALEPTDVATSLSRIGSIAPDALNVDPLPPMRITSPSLPVYGGPPTAFGTYAPRAKEPVFKGPVAAVAVVIVFVILGGLAFLLYKFLQPPTPPPQPVGGDAPALVDRA
jgi:hypothetical protein